MQLIGTHFRPSNSTTVRQGILIYVVGPSGSGKDTLLRFARDALPADDFVFVHRYITRPPTEDENHIALSAAEFEARKRAGLFALQWASHGYSYGVGIEVEALLDRGFVAIINGSREAWASLPIRRRRATMAILIDASPQCRAQRLRFRSRDSVLQQTERLARTRTVGEPLVTIFNNDEIDVAGAALVRTLIDVAEGRRGHD